ncbi:hypothetical protein AURDEDRAFT_166318 [Auricularia subglabra TFB-10046 SS5]|uniref:MYND-type domain-containing protein n=1 Tax=Auricularia subglabra (strain TFB-10046 / SS5) TaxID=717982 RepID=J0DDK7_AURST|nr:hypothetical protein AURDEDRAFT_166318 [Auricularia subglabra TFB-10046 SS5]
MAGLKLLIRALLSADPNRLRELLSDVIPLVQTLIVESKVDDIVLELALDAWEEWAVLMQHDEDCGFPLVSTMLRLACACGDTSRRQVASQILRRLQVVTCTTGILAKEEEISTPMRKFFIAALRYDSAGDRLITLRGLYNSFPADDDFTPHPVLHMSAADYTCLTGEAQFYELDTTASDTKHILELRAEFVSCMRSFCASRDLHALADRLHAILVQDPRAVDFSPRSILLFADGKEPHDLQLSFTSWADVLQHCAYALRTCSQIACPTSHHRRGANILEMQRFILRRSMSDNATMAWKLVKKRDVSVLWYWYALCHDVDGRSILAVVDTLENLRTAESESPLTKTPLYQCAMATLALSTLEYVLLRNLETDLREDWRELSELGPVAAWAASEYLRVAPFDGQYAAEMNAVFLLCHIWRYGTSSATRPTPAFRFNFEARWRAAKSVQTRIWGNPVSGRLNRTVDALYAYYADSVSTFDGVLSRHIGSTPPPARMDDSDGLRRGDLYLGSRKFSRAGIAAWRELIDDDERGRRVCWRDAPLELLPEILQIGPNLRVRACNYCGVRSVALRYCGSCKRARYCSKECRLEGMPQAFMSEN